MASRRGDPEIERRTALLGASDPSPVGITNADGRSLFLLLGDHAGNAVPARLAMLGLSAADLNRHIALDIGVSALGADLAQRLDAPFVEQRYSRLVVDCNRAPEAADAIAAASDGTAIPGNGDLPQSARSERYRQIFDPYHAAIAKLLSDRPAAIVVSLHSFTPTLGGFTRPWTIGVLHDDGETAFALAVLRALRRHAGTSIGDNAPYRMDATDFTVPRHAYPGRLPYVELEIRQDMLASAETRLAITGYLVEALKYAQYQISA